MITRIYVCRLPADDLLTACLSVAKGRPTSWFNSNFPDYRGYAAGTLVMLRQMETKAGSAGIGLTLTVSPDKEVWWAVEALGDFAPRSDPEVEVKHVSPGGLVRVVAARKLENAERLSEAFRKISERRPKRKYPGNAQELLLVI